jgi:hypothetical protein
MTGDCSRHRLRGGSWASFADEVRCANRGRAATGARVSIISFRVGRTGLYLGLRPQPARHQRGLLLAPKRKYGWEREGLRAEGKQLGRRTVEQSHRG